MSHHKINKGAKKRLIPFNHKSPNFKNSSFQKKYGDFKKAWRWHDENGNWLFCTVRYENELGKNIIPFTYENGNWFPGHPIKENRPLMDLHIIIEDKIKPILLVEGEKCYSAAINLLSDYYITTTWSGGTGGIAKTDFTPIKNRKVYYWYDHDNPGYDSIDFFKEKLNNLILIKPSVDTKKGWDIADAILNENWSQDDLLVFISQFKEKEKKSEQIFVDEIKYPFEVLGYNMGYMFFLPRETGQIYKIKKGSLNNQHLLEIAPLEFWKSNYGFETKRGSGVSWIDAQDDLIRNCNAKNPFSYNNIRGRGAWKEKDNIIIHTGKQLFFGQEMIDVQDYSPNGHVYERLPELNLNIINKELTENEIDKIKECFRKLSISTRLELNYLIGWCVLAPFCGALSWRPHIWITGPAGSGKSAVVQMIVHKMLGEFIFCPEGDSTGAGIIQGLKNDSLPVVHDEIDRTNIGINNLEIELSITRSSSSASEKTKLYKGTSDQIGKQYNYNSMFCFSSINLYLNKKSDKSRFSIINLEKNLLLPWSEFKKEIQNVFTKKICSKIRSKTFYNWKTIQENIETFRTSVAKYLGDQRTGDQIGTLLAGAASLMNMKKYKEKEIDKICDGSLKGYISADDYLTDEIECLMKIFTSRITYINYNEHREETTLLNLLHLAVGNIDRGPDKRAEKELYKYGIKYKDTKKMVYIAINYEWIKNILKDTAWKYNYVTIIKRLSFVKKETEVQYFGNYYNGRALAIKADYLLRLSDDEVFMEAGF